MGETGAGNCPNYQHHCFHLDARTDLETEICCWCNAERTTYIAPRLHGPHRLNNPSLDRDEVSGRLGFEADLSAGVR